MTLEELEATVASAEEAEATEDTDDEFAQALELLGDCQEIMEKVVRASRTQGRLSIGNRDTMRDLLAELQEFLTDYQTVEMDDDDETADV